MQYVASQINKEKKKHFQNKNKLIKIAGVCGYVRLRNRESFRLSFSIFCSHFENINFFFTQK